MASGRSRDKQEKTLRRTLVIDDVFRVQDITRQVGRQRVSRPAITLTSQGKQYCAIAGPDAAAFAAGDIVHLRGCVLQRAGNLVLVVCSLKARNPPKQDDLEGPRWKRGLRY